MELVAADVARLTPAHLAALPLEVARPAYDRDALRVGIVHLGLGAFARAHLAAVNEAALHASGGADLAWGICGVSLRQADTRDALAPQAGLYTLALRSADANGREQQQATVIGCLLEMLVAPEDPQAVLARIAHADTRIVSVTVTEKGYCHDPASGRLNLQHPDIVHDLAQAQAPRSTIGSLVRGLQQRRAAGQGPITLMSLDNLPSNGHLLRGMVLAFARQVDPALATWIETLCTFPCSMVDRIVPRTTDQDRRDVARTLGLHDAWPVLGEPYLEWVVEDQFAAGRPDWASGGARFVAEAAPFETLKLRTVNGVHSALAYLSVMAGWATVDEAMAQPALKAYLAALMQDEIVPTLPPLPGLDLARYQQRLLQRFENPALKHQTRQIAMDGSQKLPQRLLDTVRARLAADLPIGKLALAVAAWLHFLRGVDEAGLRYDIQDPMAAELAQRYAQAELAAERGGPVPAAMLAWTETLTGLAAVFGDLGADPRFVRAVSQAAHALRSQGVGGALNGALA
ncbi:Polyol:NADP oxidoreductase [Achromobacter spanius]|uniref:mannitol dehydrogenase family protein n=1 Tax=Achromobacter spanius TaxID=217203 RepID=UPI000C2CE034|nr:mannitol dehydrogenase family protein [Achromobacter spanius]AUA55202.1 mannitol dehydrogenase [Achromobacter spanius]CAB3712507.1 Polyol:NADP oxidoreductase [Achromobacter spanius]SPT41265.1 Polyol:NADP oxidoreductase [Achromobacter denitrificans]VEE57351.1 Polyol:NADP oxidoreductase [Achromobacter spanius]